MPLTNRRMKPAETNQPMVMMGRRSMASDLHSRRTYAAGKSMPANMTWMPMTMRKIWNDRLCRASSSKSVHCHGEIQSSPIGPTAAGRHIAVSMGVVVHATARATHRCRGKAQ